MQKCGENIREENGGNIDSICFVRRKLLWKKRGKEKRKFVVIIWRGRENREERREIRAVFAPQQAVYSRKLYLVPATLPCSLPSILCASHACSLHFVHVSGKLSLLFAQQINQAIFPYSNKLINHILQFGNLSFYSLTE